MVGEVPTAIPEKRLQEDSPLVVMTTPRRPPSLPLPCSAACLSCEGGREDERQFELHQGGVTVASQQSQESPLGVRCL